VPRGDAELERLFLEELERHLGTLSDEISSSDERRRALHAVKGAAGLVGEIPLADAIGRLERRVRDGDGSAEGDAEQLLRDAIGAVRRGEPALRSSWPEPPRELAPRVADDDPLQPTYEAEMRDRLSRLDDAISARTSPTGALASSLREVHAIKGAASAVGDEPMAWFCHGLEGHLRPHLIEPSSAPRGLAELASFRGVLAELVVDPRSALDRLRSRGGDPAQRRPVGSPQGAAQPGAPQGDDDARDGSVRIPQGALDGLVEGLGQLGLLGVQIAATTGQARSASRSLRHGAALLAEALRLIGPPRPWGAPAAALSRIAQSAQLASQVADALETSAASVRDRTDDLEAGAARATSALRELRRTAIGKLLDRVRLAIEAQAAREGRQVRVIVSGGELAVDRHLAEQLIDPLLQLARNALAHGFEPTEARVAAGKPAAGTLLLSAWLDTDRLRVLIEDDGAGVDTVLVRSRAVSVGLLPADVAPELDDEALLELIFAPGFTTRTDADLLAGRGMGLDLVTAALRRLGGAIRLSSSPGRGVSAVLDVPVDPGLLPVLWVVASGTTYALPARAVARVLLPHPDEPAPHLTSLLAPTHGASPSAPPGPLAAPAPPPRPPAPHAPAEPPATSPMASPMAPALAPAPGAARVLELRSPRGQVPLARVCVDQIGGIADVTLRAVSPLVLAAGPYRGAVVHPDGRLQLVLDVQGLLDLLP
jgi:two-component system, chemotaxis family, sensor kinase CheA